MIDHTVDDFFESRLCRAWGLAKLPSSKQRGKDGVWKKLLAYLKVDEDSVDQTLALRAPVLKFLEQHIPRLMDDTLVADVPLNSVRRALQAWHDRVNTNQADKDTMCAEVKTLRTMVRASVTRDSPPLVRTPPPPPPPPSAVHHHSSAVHPALLSAQASAGPRKLIHALEEEEEEEEDEEEEDGVPGKSYYMQFPSMTAPHLPPTQTTERSRLTTKELLRNSTKPPSRLQRTFDDLDIDAPSCKLRTTALTNSDRWRRYSSQHVYESVSKYFLDFPGDRTRGVAHEIIEFVEEELPDIVDHIFMLPIQTPQYQHYCRVVDRRLSKIHFKWTIAHKGLKIANEVKHEATRFDPEMTDWLRAFHTVNARSTAQGFQQPAQTGASGTSGKKSTSN